MTRPTDSQNSDACYVKKDEFPNSLLLCILIYLREKLIMFVKNTRRNIYLKQIFGTDALGPFIISNTLCNRMINTHEMY